MSLAEDFNTELYSIETRFQGGLSNTSTKKFDELIKIVSKISDVDEEKIYITAATSRASNLWNRLAQGKPLTQHFSLALGIIDASDLQGGLSPASKFIGVGIGHYDAIALAVKRNDKWVVGAVLDTGVLPIFDKFSATFPGVSIAHDVVSLAAPANDAYEANFAWYVGADGNDASGERHDYSDEFINQGTWTNGWKDKFIDEVKSIKTGDRIVIKTVFNQKNDLPFDNNGKKVGAMRLKAIGTVVGNNGDGKTIKVEWAKLDPQKIWFGPGTLRSTIHGVSAKDGPIKRQLLDFTFGDAEQDFSICEEYYMDDLDDNLGNSESGTSSGEGINLVNPPATSKISCLDITRDAILNRVHPVNMIIYGAPGTGKTYSMLEYALAIIDNVTLDVFRENNPNRKTNISRYKSFVKSGQIVFTTFHQNYGYEEFIQGLRPNQDSANMSFVIVDGVFKTIADTALKDTEGKNYVILIDEINRANISRVFGELITLIEDDKRWGELNETSATLQSGDPFAVPNNLYIVGTMNSADKSISLIDTALRRRFNFIEQKPNLDLVEDSVLKSMMECINLSLVQELDSTDLLVGHSYFMNKTTENLCDILNNNIIPLLYEYFYDSRKKVANILKDAVDRSGAQIAIVDEKIGRLRVEEM